MAAPAPSSRAASTSAPPARDVYALLVGLAARAPVLSAEELRQALVDGVAQHYGASACTLHTDDSGWPVAQSDAQHALGRLPALARARVETIDARLARSCRSGAAAVSAVDIDPDLRSDAFLTEVLGVGDVFAVPLRRAGRVDGALVLYLPPSSRSLGEADLDALAGLGEILALAGSPAPDLRAPAPSSGGARSLLRRWFS